MKKIVWTGIYIGTIVLSLTFFVLSLKYFINYYYYACTSVLYNSFSGCMKVYAFSFILVGFYMSHMILSDQFADKFFYRINGFLCVALSFGYVVISLWLTFSYVEAIFPMIILVGLFLCLISSVFFNKNFFSLSNRKSVALSGFCILIIFFFFLSPRLAFNPKPGPASRIQYIVSMA